MLKRKWNVRQWFAGNLIHVLSFVLPLGIMLFLFILRSIYPFGDESFLHSDMYHQYMPFFSELLHKLKNGEDLFYSWNVGMGSNFLALYVYYLASPFNWLLVFCPESYLLEFMSYLIILKIALCGLTFSIYLRGHFNTKSYGIVFFSCFYALSGFIAAYNWDIMWLDCVFLAPLILLGLERLADGKKGRLYCVTLALCILSNYYISIMICIYIVLYYLVLILCRPRRVRSAGRFVLYSALAGGMAAVLLLPELFALHFTEFSDFNFPSKVSSYFSVLDMLARQFVNVTTEQGLKHWPNIYCGVAVLFLLPLYAANRKIPLRERIIKLSLTAFLLISFSTNVLNFIWHGFNYPDSLPCRQSFLYILLLLTLCFEAFLHLKETEGKKIVLCFWGCLFFIMVCEQTVENKDAYPFGAFLATYILLAVYAGLAWIYRRVCGGEASGKAVRLLAYITTLIVVFESAMNMGVTSVSTTSRSKYLSGHDAYHQLVEFARGIDRDFYRFEKFSRVTKNDGTLIGYPTASLFSSTANSYVGDFYEKLGMSNSKVFYCFEGATPLTSALLNVKYMFSRNGDEENSLYTLIGHRDDVYLYRANYTLPLGYMVEEAFEEAGEDGYHAPLGAGGTADTAEEEAGSESDLFSEIFGEPMQDTAQDILEAGLEHGDFTPLETQNRLAQALGLPDLFIPVTTTAEGDTTALLTEETGYYYGFVSNSKIKTATAFINEEKKEFKKLNHEYILDFGRINAGDRLEVTSSDDEALLLSAYRMDEKVLSDMISILNRQTMTVDSFDSTHVEGHITVTDPGQLIITIPYEPGWTLLVDGKETEMGRFADTFMSVGLNAGEHTLSLSYYPAGLNAGIAVSLLCLAAFGGTVWLGRKKRRG